jgi:hypothetical protein
MGLLDRDNLYCVRTDETVNAPSMTIQDWINRADIRGDDTFKLQTHDGFTVYERFYHHNADGTKDIVDKLYLKENELTPREAVEAMLNRERLVDFENPADIAEYRWNGENFIKYDSYYYDSDEIISKFTGLQRKVENKELDLEREKIRVREILGFDLDLSGLPQIRTRYGLSGAMFQAISMCKAQKWEINETHVHSVLAHLDSDLESMFPSYDYSEYETNKSTNNKRRKKEMSAKKATPPKPKAKKITKKATSKAKTPAKTKAALKGKQRPK